MHYGAIKAPDIANGTGCRVSIFVSGCRNHCKGCFQPETWDFNYGMEYTEDVLDEILAIMEQPWIEGLSVLGGDPLEPENLPDVFRLCFSAKFMFPGKSVWLYTGYKWEGIQDLKIMQYVDVLVDGRFHEDEKDISLKFRGSRNQRIIDVRKTLESGEVILWQDSLQERLLRQ